MHPESCMFKKVTNAQTEIGKIIPWSEMSRILKNVLLH